MAFGMNPMQQQQRWMASPNQTSTTDQLVQQAAAAMPPQEGQSPYNNAPTYRGAYNPMFHAANNQPISMKDLASLYYKSQGQGVVGDNPRVWKAAQEYGKVGLGDWNEGIVPGLVGGSPVKSPDEVKDILRAQIDLAGGNRQAVLDSLAGKVNNRITKQNAGKAGVSAKDAAALQAAGGGGQGGQSTPGQDAVMTDWFNQNVKPYVDQQTAMLNAQAALFDDTVNKILPGMDAGDADIVKAYFPLISASYHQKAATFGNDFINGDDATSLIGQLMTHAKRNKAVLNWLTANGAGGGDANSFLSNLTSQG